MADEANKEVVVEEAVGVEEGIESKSEESTKLANSEVVVSEVEKKAMQFGWKPKAQFTGNVDDWKPAKSFVEYGDMVGKIRELEKTIDTLVKHNSQVEDSTRKRVLEELKEAQKSAVEIGDTESVSRITDKISEIKAESKIQPSTPELPIEVSDFIVRNSDWFNDKTAENSARKMYAIARDNELMKELPSLPVTERLKLIEHDVAHRFNKQSVISKVQPVISPSQGASRPSKKSITYDTLTTQQKRAFDVFKNLIPDYTPEKYLKALDGDKDHE